MRRLKDDELRLLDGISRGTAAQVECSPARRRLLMRRFEQEQLISHGWLTERGINALERSGVTLSPESAPETVVIPPTPEVTCNADNDILRFWRPPVEPEAGPAADSISGQPVQDPPDGFVE